MNPKAFCRMLNDLPDALERADITEPILELAGMMQQAIADNFARAENSDGSKWPARTSGGRHPLLRKTDTLYRAVTGGLNSGGLQRDGLHSLTFGLDEIAIPYARRHNDGLGNMPQREFAYLRPQDVQQIRDRAPEIVLQRVEQIVQQLAMSYM